MGRRMVVHYHDLYFAAARTRRRQDLPDQPGRILPEAVVNNDHGDAGDQKRGWRPAQSTPLAQANFSQRARHSGKSRSHGVPSLNTAGSAIGLLRKGKV